jgi:ribosome-binding protein aMBF1 (putative translation factor)
MTISPDQCKTARQLLGLSLEELANSVKLSEFDVARFESGRIHMTFIGAAIIQRALEINGIEFVDAPPGAKLSGRCTPAQFKAAREALGISQLALAVMTQVGDRSIGEFEAGRRDLPADVKDHVKRAFEAAGVEFVPGTPGIRMKAPE